MTKNIGFFQDKYGKSSPGRWLSFILLLAAVVTGLMTFNLKSKAAGVNITYSLVAAAFGIKGFNKTKEKQPEGKT